MMEDVEIICARGWEQRRQAEESGVQAMSGQNTQGGAEDRPDPELNRFWRRCSRVGRIAMTVEGVVLAVAGCWTWAGAAALGVALFWGLERMWFHG